MSSKHNDESEYVESPKDNGGTAPPGNDWGERTMQSCRNYKPPERWETDAYEMRRCFGVPELDEENDYKENPRARMTWPNLLIHERNPTRSTNDPGGEAAVFRGDRGSGKSTLLREANIRILSENTEIVDGRVQGEFSVWRGTPERSEWLDLRKWTTLYLPKHASIDAIWMDEDEDISSGEPISEVDDLEDIVRDVVYYESVLDLLEKLSKGPAGTFNVVYPDPSFQGCTELSRETSRGQFDELPYVPAWEARNQDGVQPTPTSHWWFMFLVAAVDYSAYYKFMTFTFDEGGDLMPQRARQDQHRLYDKVELARSCIADSRREGLTILMGIHRKENVKAAILKEFKRWVWMPQGTSNPVKHRASTHPPGWSSVSMPFDMMGHREDPSDAPIALCFTESQDTEFRWSDVSTGEYSGKKLVIRLGEPEEKPTPDGVDEPEPELEYDDSVFGEWENQTAHRLYVKDPGDGYINLKAGEIGEELTSPVADLKFVDGLVDGDRHREVRMRNADGEELVVARIPSDSLPDTSGSGQEGVGA
ncbi:hypothetical protein [Haloarcula amylolytica]|uniref:hypothetical protein n=1 Tax=Haloarcula amylolytica TaxID=396317 RepID=UPI003C75E3F3